MSNHQICVISSDRIWNEAMRKHFASQWRVRHYKTTDELFIHQHDAFACVLMNPATEEEFQESLTLPIQLWQQPTVVPVIVMLDDHRTQWRALSWEHNAAGVLSTALSCDSVLAYVTRLIQRWQPLREATQGLRRFQERVARLSPRETFIMERLADGWWIKRIAHVLGTSAHTVRNQRASLLSKLELDSEKEMIRIALTARWTAALASARGLIETGERPRQLTTAGSGTTACG